MARRKLNPFTADEASDNFTPSVKTIKGGDVKSSKNESKSTKKENITKTESKPKSKPAVKPKAPDAPAEKKTSTKPSQTSSKSVSPSKTEDNALPPILMESAKEKQASRPPAPAQTTSPDRKKKFVKPERTKSKTKESVDVEQEIIFELVGFRLGEEEFGININNVHEINRMVEITPVPRAPHFVMGVINLRGKVVPVLSLRKRLNTDEKEADSKTRIVVVEVKGTVVGFIVDEVTEVLRIPARSVEPAPDLVAGIQSDYIKGVAKLNARLMILLDLDKVLSKDQIEQLKESSS